jgi:hypothetical protein
MTQVDFTHHAYDENALFPLLARDGKTDELGEDFVMFRPYGNACQDKFGTYGKWILGLLDGDFKPNFPSTVYKDTSGVSAKDLGLQKTGSEFTFDLPLKNLTPYAKSLSVGSDYDAFTVAYSPTNPGATVVTLTLSADLIADNVFAFTLKTWKIADGTEISTSCTATYAVSHDATMDNLVADAEVNGGIDAAGTDAALKVLTITAKDGYYLEVTGEEVTLGLSQPTVTKVYTYPSISTAVDNTSGTITKLQLPITAGDIGKFAVGMEIEVPTGNATMGILPEYVHISRIENGTKKVLHLTQALSQLPENAAVIKMVAGKTFPPSLTTLGEHITIMVQQHDNSAKRVREWHVYNVYVEDQEPMNRTKDAGGKCVLKCRAIAEPIYDSGTGTYSFEYFDLKETNSIVSV